MHGEKLQPDWFYSRRKINFFDTPKQNDQRHDEMLFSLKSTLRETFTKNRSKTLHMRKPP